MAGEVERFISPSSIALKVKPAKDVKYHEKLIASNKAMSMESYLSDKLNEDLILNWLLSNDCKVRALECLEKHLQENHGILMFHNKESLFEGFATALDSSDKASHLCTKFISKIVPQLGGDLDKYMEKVLCHIISNIGNRAVTLQKESMQALHIYMKHSLDIYPLLKAIAHHGIQHRDAKVRKQIIYSFPTLLFPEFKDEDFFDVVHSLVTNLTETLVDHDTTLHVLDKLSEFIGKTVFNDYISRLSSPLQHAYYHCCTASVDKLIDTKAPNRIALHSKHAESLHNPNISTSSIDDRLPTENHSGNFANSGHFDAVPSRRRHPFNAYSSNVQEPLSDSQNYSANSRIKSSELSVPDSIISQFSSSEHSVRLQALDAFKEVLLKDTSTISDNVAPLLSLLQPLYNDKNFRVACGALKVISIIISKLGSDLNKHWRLLVNVVSSKFGHAKDAVRSDCYKILLQIMGGIGYQKVLDLLWNKLELNKWKVREDFLCFIIATLLTSLKSRNYKDLDFDEICKHVAGCLTDSQPNVRKASLDCIAVLGQILGTTSREILSAVDKVELQHDNASGIMSAVQARLLKHQLPRLNENMLVEYAIFPSGNASVGSLQGADIQWVLAAERLRKSGSPIGLRASQENVKQLYKLESARSLDGASSNSNPARRNLSAGKLRQQFPWASQEDFVTSNLPSSAPVNGVKVR